ncbi:unnamed protein product [Amoebophrya sp. A25]|nr:unnamed protein product [Amoebophrya sp. A25]|eukprot:GSA25T00006847001.1
MPRAEGSQMDGFGGAFVVDEGWTEYEVDEHPVARKERLSRGEEDSLKKDKKSKNGSPKAGVAGAEETKSTSIELQKGQRRSLLQRFYTTLTGADDEDEDASADSSKGKNKGALDGSSGSSTSKGAVITGDKKQVDLTHWGGSPVNWLSVLDFEDIRRQAAAVDRYEKEKRIQRSVRWICRHWRRVSAMATNKDNVPEELRRRPLMVDRLAADQKKLEEILARKGLGMSPNPSKSPLQRRRSLEELVEDMEDSGEAKILDLRSEEAGFAPITDTQKVWRRLSSDAQNLMEQLKVEEDVVGDAAAATKTDDAGASAPSEDAQGDSEKDPSAADNKSSVKKTKTVEFVGGSEGEALFKQLAQLQQLANDGVERKKLEEIDPSSATSNGETDKEKNNKTRDKYKKGITSLQDRLASKLAEEEKLRHGVQTDEEENDSWEQLNADMRKLHDMMDEVLALQSADNLYESVNGKVTKQKATKKREERRASRERDRQKIEERLQTLEARHLDADGIVNRLIQARLSATGTSLNTDSGGANTDTAAAVGAGARAATADAIAAKGYSSAASLLSADMEDMQARLRDSSQARRVSVADILAKDNARIAAEKNKRDSSASPEVVRAKDLQDVPLAGHSRASVKVGLPETLRSPESPFKRSQSMKVGGVGEMEASWTKDTSGGDATVQANRSTGIKEPPTGATATSKAGSRAGSKEANATPRAARNKSASKEASASSSTAANKAATTSAAKAQLTAATAKVAQAAKVTSTTAAGAADTAANKGAPARQQTLYFSEPCDESSCSARSASELQQMKGGLSSMKLGSEQMKSLSSRLHKMRVSAMFDAAEEINTMEYVEPEVEVDSQQLHFSRSGIDGREDERLPQQNKMKQQNTKQQTLFSSSLRPRAAPIFKNFVPTSDSDANVCPPHKVPARSDPRVLQKVEKLKQASRLNSSRSQTTSRSSHVPAQDGSVANTNVSTFSSTSAAPTSALWGSNRGIQQRPVHLFTTQGATSTGVPGGLWGAPTASSRSNYLQSRSQNLVIGRLSDVTSGSGIKPKQIAQGKRQMFGPGEVIQQMVAGDLVEEEVSSSEETA